jgi:hypothetical protein
MGIYREENAEDKNKLVCHLSNVRYLRLECSCSI